MKKKKRKLNFKKFIIVCGGIILMLYFYVKNDFFITTNEPVISNNVSSQQSNSDYKIIKEDSNTNYSGIGQQKVSNKDGYFTTFTTFGSNKKIYKEFKQNSNSSWSNKEYWGGTMTENGCGITSIAIILSGYGKNYTPDSLRKKYSPVLNSEDISKELSKTYKIKNSDFYFDSVHLSKDSIFEHLKTDRPILICIWNKPTDNRWTTASHYMVLLATDDNNKVYVSNPNGLENDSKSSGWYDIDEITPFLAKALYIESYN